MSNDDLQEKAREIASELLEWSSQLSWDDHGLDDVDTKGFISFVGRRVAAVLVEERRAAKDGIVAEIKAREQELWNYNGEYITVADVLAILDKWLGGIQR